MGLFLLVTGAVNYLIDPYWYRDKRTKYINSLPIADIDQIIPVLNVFRLHSKGDAVKFSIIGTSHVFRGISDCNYPFLEKIAVSQMSIPESSVLLQKMLERSSVQKTVFIEVCGINQLPTVRDENFFNRIFSLRSIGYSIKTIKNNLISPQVATTPACTPFIGKTDTLHSIDELNSKVELLRPLIAEEITYIKKMSAIGYQPKNRLQHQVIFFISPLPSETMEKEKYRLINQKLSMQMKKIIISMQSSGSRIRFKFINLLDTEIGKEYQFKRNNFYDGWYDGAHFKPVIGDKVMRYLLNQTEK